MESFGGRVAVITGASSGIGRALALELAGRGAMFAHADAVRADFGAVNLVVNNAGVAMNTDVLETSVEDYEWIFSINFWGVLYGSTAFLPHLIASGDGHLVNVSSLFGMIGAPSQSAYCATKFAVRGFTEALRQEMLVAGPGSSSEPTPGCSISSSASPAPAIKPSSLALSSGWTG